MSNNNPWIKFYGSVPATLSYPETTLYGSLVETVSKYPDQIAWEFLGTKYTYRKFLQEIDQFAKGLFYSVGIKQNDVVTISMPTSPQGIIPIYAINKLGAISALIHPLSPPDKIKYYLNVSNSKYAITLDNFYSNFDKILENTSVDKVIVSKISDYLSRPKKLIFNLTKGRKISKMRPSSKIIWYSDLMNQTYPEIVKDNINTNDCAVIMYSGGTTGDSKGIMLSNRNLISEGIQASCWGNMKPKDKILAILPIFHGFGLGVCINSAFMSGATSILVPTFTPDTVAILVRKYKPQFLIGVPTLFEILSNNSKFKNSDLSCLKTCFSGADTLPRSTKEKFESIVNKKGGNVKLLEGYGLTEAVTAIMAMPLQEYRENSIGVPFPDIQAKIVKIGTIEEAENLEEGELCINGPPVMLGYLNNQQETNKALKIHQDGYKWLHTGDICYRDTDGFFYFRSRLKQMIKVSGYNVYPKSIEEILRNQPAINKVCVVGIPDTKKGAKIKAFIVLKDNIEPTDEIKEEIKRFSLEKLFKWESPQEIEFKKELPLTLIGKVDYKQLEQIEINKLNEMIESQQNELEIT